MEQRKRESNVGVSGGEVFCRVYLKTGRENLAELRFTLEAYDGVGFIRTVDRKASIIEFCYPPSQAELAEELMGALAKSLPLERVERPEGVIPL